MLMLSAVGTSLIQCVIRKQWASARFLVYLFVEFLGRKSPCDSKTGCQEFGVSLLLYCSM